MPINYGFDGEGTVTFVGDADPTRKQIMPAGTSQADVEAAQVAFFEKEPKMVPDQVPLWAAQAALKMAGKFDSIDTAVLGMKNSNPAAYFAWTMGNFASRRSALIAALAPVEQMTDEDIDAVFIAADTIANAAG